MLNNYSITLKELSLFQTENYFNIPLIYYNTRFYNSLLASSVR